MDEQDLSDLIGEVYDTALAPANWPRVLEGICGYVNGCAAMVFWHDVALLHGGRYFSFNDDPHWTRLYFEKYIKYNPVIPMMSFSAIMQVQSIRDLVPWDEMQQTLFYREWMEPQGYLDNLFANLERSATSSAAFAVARDTRLGPGDEEMRRRMSLVVPHVRRAVLIGKVFQNEQARSAAFARTLDELSTAVLLTDLDGRLLHANKAGQAFIDRSDLLSLDNGMLRATAEETRREFRDALAAARLGDGGIGARGIAIAMRDRAGQAYVGTLLPLGRGARQNLGEMFGAAVALFINATSLDVPDALDVLRTVHRLTAGEVRVLHAVTEGGSVADLAARLGLAVATVKNHLHNLYQKTGTTRRADLVRLVAAHLGPLRRHA